MEPLLPATPKRNSGHTGRRRLSEAEAALRGPQALRDHRRNYGRAVSADNPMPPPPAWFTEPMVKLWDEVVSAAPAGVLHRVDYQNVVVLVGAMHRHSVLLAAWLEYQVATPPMLPTADLERRVRLAGAEVNRASAILGLVPVRRSGVPEQAEPGDPFFRFVAVAPGSA
jgi:hypothetical protein